MQKSIKKLINTIYCEILNNLFHQEFHKIAEDIINFVK